MSADLIKTISSTIARHRMVRAGDRVGVACFGRLGFRGFAADFACAKGAARNSPERRALQSWLAWRGFGRRRALRRGIGRATGASTYFRQGRCRGCRARKALEPGRCSAALALWIFWLAGDGRANRSCCRGAHGRRPGRDGAGASDARHGPRGALRNLPGEGPRGPAVYRRSTRRTCGNTCIASASHGGKMRRTATLPGCVRGYASACCRCSRPRVQPSIVRNLGRLAALSREDEAFWRVLTAGLLEGSLRQEGGRICIRCSDLLGVRSLPNTELSDEARLAIARRLVRGIVEKVRGDCRQWTTDHVERVIWLASEGSSGSRVELPGVIAERSFDWVWFSPAEEWRRGDAEGSPQDGSRQAFWQVVEVGNPGESTLIAVPEIRRRFRLKVVDWHAWRRDTEADKCALDRDLLSSPLVLRNWHPGDSFRPKGRRSAHKLKHLLRIGRVKASAREGWPVLTSASLLVWARGLPIAAEVATGPTTRSGVVITEEEL